MRYGVVRSSAGFPPPSVQRRLIMAAGCDVVLEEGDHRLASHRSLVQLLFSLKDGDEVLLYGLDALEAHTGELARLLRRFFEAGVTLRIVGGSRIETLAPDGSIPRALALLADHDTRRPVDTVMRKRVRTAASPLTQHQLRYARGMHRRGHSMREIGLLFRLAPSEIAQILRSDRSDIAEAEDDAPDPPPWAASQ